ncbi:T9SS type A sorting domain-containing protein [Parabacteroides goldsteinii]|uniref:T9SS type A sorting domain-containing protein n=1 Tax=Parabacteroides goldsteinii TaxID=328812 RepID=UPI001CCD086E|nr:T9SS type A sorting domain-containing protein [Parabacteroides goldsteinii]
MKITVQRPCAVLRLFAGLFFLFMTFAATAGNPDDWENNAATSIANVDGGDGTSFDHPILIASAEELAYFARQVNDGGRELTVDNGGSIDKSSTSGTSGFFGYYFALSADIDLKGKNWVPIGNGSTAYFCAHFDGKGHKVKGLKVKIKSDDTTIAVFAGLFGNVINGTLQNLGVELADEGIEAASTGYDVYAGGITGRIQGFDGAATLRNCYVEGKGAIKITGTGNGKSASAGGIAGAADAAGTGTGSLTLTNCYATVNVEATASDKCRVGGIAGYAPGLSYTYATGDVRAQGGTEQCAGGICGLSNGSSELSHNLALNKSVSGIGDNIHRIASSYTSTVLNYLSNYANPGVKVNYKAVSGSTSDSQDGGNTSLEDFESVLRNAPSNDNAWSTAWVFPEDNLPQLRMATDDGKGTPSFAAWPAGSQTDYLASNYLNAFIWSDYAATSIANVNGGDGKSFENPILIANAEELAYFARQVNARARELKLDKGESIDNSTSGKSGFSGYCFALSADIDLKGKNWMPIGNRSGASFRAHFDGKGYKVKGLKVKIKSDNTITAVFAGLFGDVINGTLQNLGVELAADGIEAASTGSYVCAGGIAGRIQGIDGAATLRNCYAEGAGAIKITETGNGNGAYAGGIAGFASAALFGTGSLTLTNCYATVEVEATASKDCYVGGIAGYALGTLSCTYATGDVRAQGGTEQYAGGICGVYSGDGELSHNLALNKNVNGTGDNIHRIVSSYNNTSTVLNYLSNYANPAMLLNGNLANSYDAGSLDGADTYRETVREDLAGVSPAAAGWEEAWDWTDGTRSPRLKLVEEATDGSLSYPGTLLAGQSPNDAFGTLAALPLLHLTQATGGTLSVTAGQPATPLNDGDAVRPGTPLTLSYSTGTDYFFEGFFSGTGQGSVDTPLGGSTVEMPRADLWLRASFRYEAPTPPEPVYYTVTLPSVEGVTTDPAAGSHQVESWDNFRFYLTLDAAYDQSVPVVTTDDGKTITPRTSDGAYVLKNVCSDLSVTISGIVKNPPVANEPVASTATRIFTRDGRLFITADRPMQAQVVALTGRIVRSLALTAGTTRIDALSPGIYLVRLDNGTVEKVIVRR